MPAWFRPDWSVLAGLYLSALGLRLLLLPSAIFGDEAHHFLVSRTFGAPVYNLEGAMRLDWLFWWRPFFSIALLPGSLISFDAFRFVHALYASLLPVFVYLLLRRLRVRPLLAISSSLVVVLHPYFLIWGARVFPDTIMAVLFMGGLWSHAEGRHRAAAVFLLGACWTKELAFFGVLGLLLLTSWDAWKRGDFRPWPLTASPAQAAYAKACALALLPTFFSMNVLGGRRPGWSIGGEPLHILERVFLLLPLAALLFVGLAWRRSRTWALLGFVYPAFLFYYHYVQHGRPEIWYYVLPGVLALVGSVVTLDEAFSRARRHKSKALSATATSTAAAVAFLLVLAIAVPPTWAPRDGILLPFSKTPDPTLFGAIEAELDREPGLAMALSVLRLEHWERVFLVDVGWFFGYYPFAYQAADYGGTVANWYTDGQSNVEPWSARVENASVTAVWRFASPLNAAILSTYGDCSIHDNPEYVVIEGQRCAGRSDALRAAWQNRTAGTP